MDFSALVISNTRPSDDYVNASKWCQAFDKHFRDYIRYQGTQKRWNAIAERIGVNSPQLKQTSRGAIGDKATVKSTLHVSKTLGEAIDGL